MERWSVTVVRTETGDRSGEQFTPLAGPASRCVARRGVCVECVMSHVRGASRAASSAALRARGGAVQSADEMCIVVAAALV